MKIKSFLIFVSIFFLTKIAFSNKTEIQVLEDNPSFTIIQIHVGEWNTTKVNTPLGNYFTFQLDRANASLIQGAPDLPLINFSISIPQNTKVTYEILESHFNEYDHYLVAPSKGKILRTQNKVDIPYWFGAEYQKNTFYPNELIQLTEPFVLRDYVGQAIHFSPMQYNPVSKALRVYQDFKIKISYQNIHTGQPNLTNEKPQKIDETFFGIYENQFVNFQANKKTRYTPITENGALLIISPAKYINETQLLVDWKKRKGFKTYFVNADTLSGGINENTIRNTAKYYYDTKNIAYMILVGDNTDIPAANENFNNPNLAGPSDISYAYISGNDHYPEFVVGRLSGETTDEIKNIVTRTLQYEQTPNTNGNWMSQQIGIASEEGTGDNNEYDFEHIHKIVDSNKVYGNYIDYYELYDGAQSKGWNDAPGFPTASDLEGRINSGASLINYTGHGGTSGIVTTSFTISEVPNLTNANKLPFFFVVGCSPGRFYNQLCFAESLLRAGTVSTPYGTISSFMSTIDQYWDEPMSAQDEFNGIMRGGRPNNLQSRLGAMCANACCFMNDKYNTLADPTGGSDMTDTWLFFGDPTVSIFNKNEGTISCTHTSEIGRNSNWYSVNCPVEGATIGLYYQGEYLADAKVVGGVATFTFPAITILDTVFITATKQNYTPYRGFAKVVDFPASTTNIEFENSILLYPNPTESIIHIQSSKENLIKHIEIMDIKGVSIFRKDIYTTDFTYDTKELNKGNYFVHIRASNGNVVKKLTIK